MLVAWGSLLPTTTSNTLLVRCTCLPHPMAHNLRLMVLLRSREDTTQAATEYRCCEDVTMRSGAVGGRRHRCQCYGLVAKVDLSYLRLLQMLHSTRICFFERSTSR